MKRTVILSADGQPQRLPLGEFKYFRLARISAPAQISFDGCTFTDCFANDATSFDTPKNVVTFRASGGLVSTVDFDFSLNPIAAQDTAQSNAKSYLFGNLGVKTGGAAAGGLPACDANGFLTITNAMRLKVPGTRNGGRRQLIVFSVSKNSAAGLNVLAPDSDPANEYAGLTLQAGDTTQLLTDSDFILSGAGGNCSVTVGQIFLVNG